MEQIAKPHLEPPDSNLCTLFEGLFRFWQKQSGDNYDLTVCWVRAQLEFFQSFEARNYFTSPQVFDPRFFGLTQKEINCSASSSLFFGRKMQNFKIVHPALR